MEKKKDEAAVVDRGILDWSNQARIKCESLLKTLLIRRRELIGQSYTKKGSMRGRKNSRVTDSAHPFNGKSSLRNSGIGKSLVRASRN